MATSQTNDSLIVLTPEEVAPPSMDAGMGSNKSGSGVDSKQPVSDEVMAILNLYVDLIFRGIIAIFGICSNIINMIIFYRLGLKDSMSVGLMGLSFTDFIVTVLGLAGTGCFAWAAMFPSFSFDPIVFQFVAFGWYRDTCYLVSGWITTILSVERCVCVVSPFKVKQIFTRTRTLVAIILLYVIHFAIHMPVFLSQWLAWDPVKVRTSNGSSVIKNKMVVHFWDNRGDIQTYIDIANGAVLPIPSQIIVVVSVFWMIYGLHASSMIRKSAATLQDEADTGDDKKKKRNKSNLSSKESRLVKVVLFLAIILTVCNIPRFMAVYAKQIFKEVSIGRKYVNVYSLLWNVSAVVGITNSSINIFVYLIVNSGYRNEFKKLFHFTDEEKKQENISVNFTRKTTPHHFLFCFKT